MPSTDSLLMPATAGLGQNEAHGWQGASYLSRHLWVHINRNLKLGPEWRLELRLYDVGCECPKQCLHCST